MTPPDTREPEDPTVPPPHRSLRLWWLLTAAAGLGVSLVLSLARRARPS